MMPLPTIAPVVSVPGIHRDKQRRRVRPHVDARIIVNGLVPFKVVGRAVFAVNRADVAHIAHVELLRVLDEQIERAIRQSQRLRRQRRSRHRADQLGRVIGFGHHQFNIVRDDRGDQAERRSIGLALPRGRGIIVFHFGGEVAFHRFGELQAGLGRRGAQHDRLGPPASNCSRSSSRAPAPAAACCARPSR